MRQCSIKLERNSCENEMIVQTEESKRNTVVKQEKLSRTNSNSGQSQGNMVNGVLQRDSSKNKVS